LYMKPDDADDEHPREAQPARGTMAFDRRVYLPNQ